MYLSKQICNVFQSKFHKIFFILFIFHVGKNFFMETTVKENMVNMILQTIPVKVQLKKYNVRTHYLQNQFILLYLLHFVIWWSWGQILPFRSSFILFDGIDGGQCIPVRVQYQQAGTFWLVDIGTAHIRVWKEREGGSYFVTITTLNRTERIVLNTNWEINITSDSIHPPLQEENLFLLLNLMVLAK